MKIENIEISKEEMNEAVQRFLDWRNVKVKVINIESVGYPIRHWNVDLATVQTDEALPTIPPIETKLAQPKATEESF